MSNISAIIKLGAFAQVASIALIGFSVVEHLSGLRSASELLMMGIAFLFIGLIAVTSGRALRELSERTERLEAQSQPRAEA